jgi:hypothetical protein
MKLNNPEFRYSLKVEDPEAGRCQRNKGRSEARVEEKGVENRVICLKHNDCSIVSRSVPEEASPSAPDICKPSSKQSLPSKRSGLHTVDTDTASMSRS